MNFNSFAVGIGLLAIPVFALFLASVLFMCGWSINSGVFPLSVILAGVVMYLACEKKRAVFWTSAISGLLLIAGALVMTAFFYDYSYDGQAYHQEIIFKLKNGWNPVYETHPEGMFTILLAHYAKGFETVSATIYSTFGNIESGKAVNLMLILASALLFFAFLKTCFEKLTQKKQLFLTFLFAFSPVAVAQVLTYYIDGAAYSLMLILIPALILFFKKSLRIIFSSSVVSCFLRGPSSSTCCFGLYSRLVCISFMPLLSSVTTFSGNF